LLEAIDRLPTAPAREEIEPGAGGEVTDNVQDGGFVVDDEQGRASGSSYALMSDVWPCARRQPSRGVHKSSIGRTVQSL
jgi:hypothetical protein